MPKDFPTIIAFSWGQEQYHRPARRLQEKCDEFNYPHSIDIDVDIDDYMKKCPPKMPGKFWVFRRIPSFILSKLDELDSNVLYLHGDFRIKKEIPEKAFEDLDIGVQKRRKYKVETSRFTMLAAPIFVRNNEASRRFLRVWEAHCQNVHEPNKTEHAYLLYLWRYFKRDKTIRKEFFDPNIASLQFDADAPILGHKDTNK